MDVNDQKSLVLAFNIGFDEKTPRPPKSLSLFKDKQSDKELLTLDKIEEKQQLANRRRQERMAAKLKRMQEREESTRKLVESTEMLLQQQSFRREKCECTIPRKLTAEELDEKQRRATERRQKRMEEKVRNTQQRREELMKLRTNVNIYMQHEKALEGEAEPEKVLSEQDAAYFAHEIAEGFSNIRSRYKNDLERVKSFSMSC